MPALLLLLLQDWVPSVERKPDGDGESLTLAGEEDVVDGAILSVSVRRETDFRRAEKDAPEDVSARLKQFDRIPVTRTERLRVEGRRWRHTMIYPKEGLVPGLYTVALEFDPTAQPLPVQERLPKDVAPFRRSCVTFLAGADDARFLADDVRRVASFIRKMNKEFNGVAEAREHGRVTRGMVMRVLSVSEGEIRSLEPYCETSAVFRTIWQLMAIPNEIGRGIAPHSSGKTPEETDPGALAGAAIEALNEGGRMFPVEFHLFMRSLLADLRDQMWAAYTASRDGRPAPWSAFRAAYAPVKRAIERAHEEMMKHEEEAATYIRLDEAEETSISKTLASLETLYGRCDEHLRDPEATKPDELALNLEKLLPPPRP